MASHTQVETMYLEKLIQNLNIKDALFRITRLTNLKQFKTLFAVCLVWGWGRQWKNQKLYINQYFT